MNHPNFKSKKIYWLDNVAMKYFVPNCQPYLQEGIDFWEENDRMVVVDKSLDKLFKDANEELKKYINQDEFISEYNKAIMRNEYANRVGDSDPNKWSFEALSYYSLEHELANVDFKRYGISRFSELPEEPVFVDKSWGSRHWKQYSICQICGTVISKSDQNHYFTILTPENEVVNINMRQEQYAHYKARLSEVDENGDKKVMDESWLKRGSLVIIAGYRRGDSFVAKRYSKSIYQHTMMKIDKVYEDGSIDIISERYGSEEE